MPNELHQSEFQVRGNTLTPYERMTCMTRSLSELTNSRYGGAYTPAFTSASRIRNRKYYRVFVPYTSFKKCAKCLSTPDLWVGLVATCRILNNLDAQYAVSWVDYSESLIRYGVYLAEELALRSGNKNFLNYLTSKITRGAWNKPDWVENYDVLKHHQAYLLWRGCCQRIKDIFKILKTEFPFNEGIRQCLLNNIGKTSLNFCTLEDIDTLSARMVSISSKYATVYLATPNYYTQYDWDVNPEG